MSDYYQNELTNNPHFFQHAISFVFRHLGQFSTKKFTISLNGQLNAKAELGATVNGATAVSVGAKGTLISITATSTLSKTTGSTYTSSNSISTSGSEISGNVSGTLTNKQTFNVNKKFSSGWTKTLS